MLAWWEIRRVAFNLLVGVTGVVTCGLIVLIAMVAGVVLGKPVSFPDPPIVVLPPILFYGIAANLCYTGGFVGEWLATRVWGAESGHFGEILFSLGVVFSVLLTVVPAFAFAAVVLVLFLVKQF